MTDYKRIAVLLLEGKSRRKIAADCGSSSKTITKIRKYLDDNNVNKDDLIKIKNEDLKEIISPRKEYKTTKIRPDYDAAHIALMQGEPIKVLWNEYNARCEASNIESISYTRFFELVKENEGKLRATEDTDIKAGRYVIAKWLNRSVETADEDGVVGKAYVFMMYFPVSQHIFLYGAKDKTAETTERIISSSFEGIGAVPFVMITDNVRSFYSNAREARPPLIHLQDHYRFIALSSVCVLSSQIQLEFMALTKQIEKTVRSNIYRSVSDLGVRLYEIQSAHASECIKGQFTRDALFKDEIRFMLPIPERRYEAFSEEDMTIQYNLHVVVEGTYYSVPYTAYLYNRSVTVRVYADRIEIYQNGMKIAQHRRTSDRYRTASAHMPPPEVLETLPWNGTRLREWAAGIGPETYRVIDGIISRHPIEQQCYVTCITILKLQDKYGSLLEKASSHVNDSSVLYAYKIICNYLKTGRPAK